MQTLSSLGQPGLSITIHSKRSNLNVFVKLFRTEQITFKSRLVGVWWCTSINPAVWRQEDCLMLQASLAYSVISCSWYDLGVKTGPTAEKLLANQFHHHIKDAVVRRDKRCGDEDKQELVQLQTVSARSSEIC